MNAGPPGLLHQPRPRLLPGLRPRVKVSFLLGFTFAAYNLDRVRSFRAKQAEIAGPTEASGQAPTRDLARLHSEPGHAN